MALLTFKYPTARKQHTCEVCGLPIIKGQKHHFQTSAFDGSVDSWRVHSDCAEMHWHHNDGRQGDDHNDDYYLDEYRGFWPHAVCRIELHSHRSKERRESKRAVSAQEWGK